MAQMYYRYVPASVNHITLKSDKSHIRTVHSQDMSIRGLFPIDAWEFKTDSVFSHLGESDTKILFAHKSELHFKKGEVIFKEGTVPSGIYFILEGKVKKFKVDNTGREHIIYVANTGELIGYHAVLAEDRYPDSAATLESSRILFIPKEDFLETISKSELLSRRLLKTLSHEFAVLINGISLLARRSVKERLALQLIILREKYKEGIAEGQDVEINISREDLANMVGTARENVIRLLGEFKDEGILTTAGRKIIVRDVLRLVEIAK
jgi:CRP-like cAMP-binding protein